MKYNCSDGTRVTQSTIDRRKTETYHRIYTGSECCAGCGGRAQGTSHIIPQKVAKDSGCAELCWLERNMIPACYVCNSIIESYKSEDFWNLFCIDHVLEVTKELMEDRYEKIQSWRPGSK